MGTSYSVKYLVKKEETPTTALNIEINKLLINFNNQVSTYIPSSEISKFNKIKKNTWFSISPEFMQVLKLSMEIAQKTQGSFDPTIGPLVNLWGFGPQGKRRVPSDDEILKASSIVGFKNLILGEARIKKLIDELYLDLSASAKGFAVDLISKLLEKNHITDYMVEIGGEVKTSGSKNGVMWKIAIESPHPNLTESSYQKILKLSGESVATSGDYRNFFEEKGKLYGHTIDYRTGRPAKHTLASVTVVDPLSCAKADAWATAMMVMGVEKALVFAEKNNIMAYLIYRPSDKNSERFLESKSSSFKRYVKTLSKEGK